MTGRTLLMSLIVGTSLLWPSGAAEAARPDPETILQRVDKDDDGSISLAEAQKAAEKHFDRLDTDHDGKISKKEAEADHVGDEAFASADSDHDGTVDRAEFAKVMEKVFQLADTDNDGKVTIEELKAPSGQTLLGMMQ